MSNYLNYVGIDVSQQDFWACFAEGAKSQRFNNTTPGINSFLRHLSTLNYSTPNTLIGLESTGSYHLRLSLKCAKLGLTVKVLNPLIVKKYNQTNLRRVKTDKKDASLIRYCLTQGAGYAFKETAQTLLLKSLVRQRNSLTNSLLKIKGYISKRGNKILRTRLYNACSVAVLHPNLFQRFFQKKRSEGKPYRVALVATMHKMTHVIYSVWSNNQPFVDYTVNQNPAKAG